MPTDKGSLLVSCRYLKVHVHPKPTLNHWHCSFNCPFQCNKSMREREREGERERDR